MPQIKKSFLCCILQFECRTFHGCGVRAAQLSGLIPLVGGTRSEHKVAEPWALLQCPVKNSVNRIPSRLQFNVPGSQEDRGLQGLTLLVLPSLGNRL